jgi:hypothetical protein
VTKVLVLANETIGGKPLLDAVLARRGEDVSFHVVVPMTRPKFGNVIYDEAVRDGAQVRVDLALAFMRDEGIEGTGEVGDPDPYNAVHDAIAEQGIDEIIVSTLPAATSGWLRRDLPERLREGTGLPVEHVVVDLANEGLPFDVTLVLANQTVGEETLLDRLKAKAAERETLFIVVVPQPTGHGHGAQEARARLTGTLKRFRAEGLLCAGAIGDPDPYKAAMNALESFTVSDVVVSTLPATRSGWLRAHLVERIADASGKPVDHVEAAERVEA